MPKGTVNVEVFKDRLRLAQSWQGKRFWLYIGLPDSRANRKAAEIKARTIELDMTSGNFDPTLAKYKPQKQESISVTDLFDRFCSWKQRNLSPKTFTKYKGTKQHVSCFFKNKTTVSVTETVAEDFRDWLGSPQGPNLEPITVRERISMMQACWNWGIKKKLIATLINQVENPWVEVKVSVFRGRLSPPKLDRLGFSRDRPHPKISAY